MDLTKAAACGTIRREKRKGMKRMNIKAAIWDLDGTLLNTLGDLCDSVNCAIVPRGFPAVDEELTRQRVGNGVAW